MVTEARRQALPAVPRVNVIGLLGVVFVALVVVWLVVNAIKTPALFYENFQIGLTQGAVYGLVALGYSLVYGILELINFAHGDVFMLGGMMAATLVGTFALEDKSGVTLWLLVAVALVVCMVFCGTLNTAIELVAYRRLRNAPRLAPLITAIGMSFILEDVGLRWKGPRPVSIPPIFPKTELFTIGGVPFTLDKLIVLLITVPVLIGLVWLVQRTRQGKSMRATAQDREAAAMMGINVNRTISFTFLLAGTLAGAAGLVYAYYVTTVSFDTGFRIGLIAFTAAVLGGIGNLPGAVLGALIIGFVEAFNNSLGWYTPGSDWTLSIVFGILILILVFRPEGLLGERTPEGG
jgi:branched-chain amino acid transport system permease protein